MLLRAFSEISKKKHVQRYFEGFVDSVLCIANQKERLKTKEIVSSIKDDTLLNQLKELSSLGYIVIGSSLEELVENLSSEAAEKPADISKIKKQTKIKLRILEYMINEKVYAIKGYPESQKDEKPKGEMRFIQLF